MNKQNIIVVPQNNLGGGRNELDQLTTETMNLMNSLKVISKKMEIVTKITYT